MGIWDRGHLGIVIVAIRFVEENRVYILLSLLQEVKILRRLWSALKGEHEISVQALWGMRNKRNNKSWQGKIDLQWETILVEE